MQTPHFAATRRDGAILTHGVVVRRWFGLHQTALLTPRPASGLHAVATAWDLIRGSLNFPDSSKMSGLRDEAQAAHHSSVFRAK
jgi:hypothetical protein